jgi:hypothetical protein
MLNTSENVFADISYSEVETIKQSFIHKILQRFDPGLQFEDHLNAQSILVELSDYKAVYVELTSKRSLELYKSFLRSESATSK